MNATLACEKESRDLGLLDHLLMHQLGPRYLCLLRAESQGVHVHLIDHSSMIGVIHHCFSQGKVARGKAVTWDALIIFS